jgi:hypothetical protein
MNGHNLIRNLSLQTFFVSGRRDVLVERLREHVSIDHGVRTPYYRATTKSLFNPIENCYQYPDLYDTLLYDWLGTHWFDKLISNPSISKELCDLYVPISRWIDFYLFRP